ncbi:MAG: glycosyltransferase family 2 protein [Calditrichaeota bacterium]|nr:glycosyltransferase family 2 protein [Calditrichota bacterium]
MKTLSVTIITRNEAKNIADCIQSVSWADEIVVVDAMSTDATVDIAKSLGAIVYQRPWTNFSDQKSFALSKASQEWVLSLDADERVSPELAEEIQSLLQEATPCDGYEIPRKTFYLGRWIRHCGWYPGFQLRLFRKEKTRLTPRKVHEGFEVTGKICRLKGDILHFTAERLEDHFNKLVLYSVLEAEEKASQKTAHWFDILVHPVSAFFRKYVALKGFLDGREGFLLSAMTALGNAMLYLKIYEIQLRERGKQEPESSD